MEKSLRTLQIITAALVMGVVAFAVVTLVVPLTGMDEGDSLESVFALILPFLAISNVGVYFVARKTALAKLAGRIRDEPDFDLSQLPPEIMGLTIVGAALAESVALVGIIFHWLTAQPVFLVGTAAAVLLMILQIPTRSRIIRLFETLKLR